MFVDYPKEICLMCDPPMKMVAFVLIVSKKHKQGDIFMSCYYEK